MTLFWLSRFRFVSYHFNCQLQQNIFFSMQLTLSGKFSQPKRKLNLHYWFKVKTILKTLF